MAYVVEALSIGRQGEETFEEVTERVQGILNSHAGADLLFAFPYGNTATNLMVIMREPTEG
jgi:hypothetical protein